MKKTNMKFLPEFKIVPATVVSILFSFLIFFSACKKDDKHECDAEKFARGKSRPIIVHKGGSIQTAVDEANPGTVILIEPGIYKGEITITKSGIQLIGMDCFSEKVIIQNPGDEDCGIMVRKGGDGFVLKNVTVKGFTENGVYLEYIDGFLLSNITAIDNDEYGLYPVHSKNGVIEYCSATGSSDTGIYVGQSEGVEMHDNIAFANVNGLEIENCSYVRAFKNHTYDNVAGILVILLPGLDVKTSSDISVYENKVENNNHINFASPGGGFEALVPSGSGILLVGVDKATIKNNQIDNNNFTGIATVSTVILGALGGLPPEAFADIEPNPDGAKIVHNQLVNNGTAPPQGLPLPGVDLLWDGSGSNNCWKNNSYTTAYPSQLPACN